MMKITANHLWKILSLLVPIPEGYAVGLAINDILHWNIVVVVISSIIMAFTGFLAIDVANHMSEFNSTLTEDEKKQKLTAPTWRGFIVLLIWFLGVMLLTVFLKVIPSLAIWTPLGLVVVGSSAAWLRSINKGQEAREQMLAQVRERQVQLLSKQAEEVRKLKEEARKARQATRKARQLEEKKLASMKQAIHSTLQVNASQKSGLASPKQSGSNDQSDGSAVTQLDNSPTGSSGSVASPRSRSARKSVIQDERLLFSYQLNPSISSGELAEKFGVSRQAIDQRRDALAKDGILKLTRAENGRVVSVEVVLPEWVGAGEGRA